MGNEAKHIFIDTNIWLSVYLSSIRKNSDSQLKTIRDKLQLSSKTKLIVTTHLRDEFYRHKEERIAELVGNFNFQLLQELKSLKEPAFLSFMSEKERKRAGELIAETNEGIEAFNKRANALKQYLDEAKNSFLKRAYEDRLPADLIVNSIFKNPSLVSQEIMTKADIRFKKGNPPRSKRVNNNLGDCIHWESLLDIVPNGTDLHFITKDSDFMSRLQDDSLDLFLKAEWVAQKSSKVFFYSEESDINQFFEEYVPSIQLDLVDMNVGNLIPDLRAHHDMVQAALGGILANQNFWEGIRKANAVLTSETVTNAIRSHQKALENLATTFSRQNHFNILRGQEEKTENDRKQDDPSERNKSNKKGNEVNPDESQ